MDELDLTAGFCGWHSETDVDDDGSTITEESELKNLFNELHVVHQPKIISYKRTATQRPKSSSMIGARRSTHTSHISKTARLSSKSNKSASSDTNTKNTIIKSYLPQTYNKKKLQRSHSNLYIRDSSKNANNDGKMTRFAQLNLKLNLKSISPNVIDPKCVAFSEKLFRSKFPEVNNLKSMNTKRNVKENIHKQQFSYDSSITDIRNNKSRILRTRNLTNNNKNVINTSNQYNKVLKNVHKHYNISCLTPSSSMLSLNNRTKIKSSRSKKKLKTHRTSYKQKQKQNTPIPIKCFNSGLLSNRSKKNRNNFKRIDDAYKHPRITVNLNYHLQNKSNKKRNISELSESKTNKTKNTYFQKHKENINPNNMNLSTSRNNILKKKTKTKSKCKESLNANISLDKRLMHIVARWESNQKIRTRKSNRTQRTRTFR